MSSWDREWEITPCEAQELGEAIIDVFKAGVKVGKKKKKNKKNKKKKNNG